MELVPLLYLISQLNAYSVEPSLIALLIFAVVNIQDAIRKSEICEELQVIARIQLVYELIIPILFVAIRRIISSLLDVFAQKFDVTVVTSFVVKSIAETGRRKLWELSDIVHEGLEELAGVIL
jgi:hypothetical protein